MAQAEQCTFQVSKPDAAEASSMIAPKRCRHGFTAARVLHLALFLSPAFTHGQQHNTGDEMRAITNGSPWTQEHHATAAQADAWFENYRFHDGESLPGLRIHYATLGSPHRDAQGKIDNAVLVIHWTGADGNTLLSKNYVEALFAPGRQRTTICDRDSRP
jgi:homoserine O-acetyltransferase